MKNIITSMGIHDLADDNTHINSKVMVEVKYKLKEIYEKNLTKNKIVFL